MIIYECPNGHESSIEPGKCIIDDCEMVEREIWLGYKRKDFYGLNLHEHEHQCFQPKTSAPSCREY